MVSWTLELPLIATEYNWSGWRVSESWHYTAALGPVSAAVTVAAITGSFGALFAQFHPSRLKPGWVVFAILSPILLFVFSAAVTRPFENGWPSLTQISKTGNLPALGLPLTWVVHVVTFGIGEETGWRGFALPRLLERHTALKATFLLTIAWGLWHLPVFFYNDDMQALGAVGTVGWSIGLFAGAVFFTWLYNSSGRSLLAIILWHGTFNTLIASEAAEGSIAVVMTTVIMVAAVALVIVGTPARLSGLRWPSLRAKTQGHE